MGNQDFMAGFIGSAVQSAQVTQQAKFQRDFRKQQLDLEQKKFKLEEQESQLKQQKFQHDLQTGDFFRNLAQMFIGPQQGQQPQQQQPFHPPMKLPEQPQGGLRQGMVGQSAPGGLELGGVNIGPSGPSFNFKQSEPKLPPGTSQEIATGLRMIGIDPTNPASYTPENLKSAQDALTKVKNQRGIPQVGTIPPGMELVRDPNTGAFSLRDIPGGPAAQEREEQNRARATISGFTVRDVRAARDLLAQRPNVAVRLGEQFVPGTPSYSLAQRIESIKGTVAIDQLLAIKRQGSGLGQVPQSQLDLLSRLMGQLSLGLTTPELDKLLQDIGDTYLEVLNRMSDKDLAKVGVAQREQRSGQTEAGQKNNTGRPKILNITPVP